MKFKLASEKTKTTNFVSFLVFSFTRHFVSCRAVKKPPCIVYFQIFVKYANYIFCIWNQYLIRKKLCNLFSVWWYSKFCLQNCNLFSCFLLYHEVKYRYIPRCLRFLSFFVLFNPVKKYFQFVLKKNKHRVSATYSLFNFASCYIFVMSLIVKFKTYFNYFKYCLAPF